MHGRFPHAGDMECRGAEFNRALRWVEVPANRQTVLPPDAEQAYPEGQSAKALSTGLFMTTFDRRDEAFGSMFAHDEETAFMAAARGAESLAAWIGSQKALAGLAAGGDAAVRERIPALSAEAPTSVMTA